MNILSFANVIPGNLRTLIKEKMAAALQEANGGEPMVNFIEFYAERPKEAHFPFATIYVDGVKDINRSPGAIGEATAVIAIEIGAMAAEDKITDELSKRVVAVDSIIVDAAKGELDKIFDGIPQELWGYIALDITTLRNGLAEPAGTQWIKVARLLMAARLTEAEA